MKWQRLAVTIILFAPVVSCAPVATPTPAATALPTATSMPTLTPTPANTPTPTLPPIAATAWASDASGKVNPQTMYLLVGAINYKHRKAIDADFVLLELAVVTDQDRSKLDRNAQKSLRTSIVARLNQNDELKKWLLNIRKELIRLYPSQPPFKVVIENDKPTQAIAETDGNLVRYSPDASGNLAKLDRYNLLPPLYVDGKDLKRRDTGDVVQLKGVDIPSPLEVTWDKDNQYSLGLMQIAKSWNANHVKLLFRARLVQPEIDDAKKIIEEAEKRGMYVIITGSGLGTEGGECACGYNDILLPNDEAIAALVKLAQAFGQYNNVILDVWNEPVKTGNDTDSVYRAISKSVQQTREAGNFKSIIVIPVLDWSIDPSYLSNRPIPDKNLIFRVQNDPFIPPNEVGTTIPDWKWDDRLDRWKQLIGVYPIFIGEWGSHWETLQGTPDQVKWYTRTLEVVNKYGLSYSQYQLGGWKEVISFDMIRRTNSGITPAMRGFAYTLNARGEAVFNDLQKFPPTQFDK